MRILFTLLASIAFLVPRAQTHALNGGAMGLPVTGAVATGWGFSPWQPYIPYGLMTSDTGTAHKWHIQPYASVSLGYLFYGGGGATYLSAPVGVALYRPLNSNFTTFAAVSVAPTVFNFNGLYNQNVPGSNFTGMSINPAVTGGLIYTNDAHTFSISGSISVERGSYPAYAPSRTNSNAVKQY